MKINGEGYLLPQLVVGDGDVGVNMRKRLTCTVNACHGRLKRHYSDCELHLSSATVPGRRRSKQRLAGREDRRCRRSKKTDRIRPKIQVARARYVEDVHEQVEMMPFARERNVFHHPKIQVEER